MIKYVLYGILFTETLIQQVTFFAFVHNFLEVKNRKIYYLSSLPIAIFGFVCDLIKDLNVSFTGTELVFTYKTVILVGAEILLIIFLTKGTVIRKIFSLIIVNITIFCLDGICVQLSRDPVVLMNPQDTPLNLKIIANLYFSVLFIVITFLLNKLLKRKSENYNNKQLLILIFFFIAQFSLVILATHNINSMTDSFSISICIVSLITIIADFIIANLVEQASEKAHLEEQIKCIEAIQKGEKDYYNNLTEKEELMSVIRHDWNEQLQTALILCTDDHSEKAEQAKQIISELNTNLIKTIPNKFTANITLNSLLNSKAKELDNQNIKYSFDIQISEQLNMDLINLCSIFSNLINNAAEYYKNHTCNENYINLKAKQIDNKIIIKCMNNLNDSKHITDSKKIKTTKKDKSNHGYGLAIIQSIAEKYNGNFHIDVTDNQFIANLYLIVAKPEEA
ncbi:MAG: GHKL domain-containing protein [Eubacterium sp.]|nr:GHKL domain-containing protein [Eubacterium sp.]